jgi:hypothetical protein
LAAFRLGFEYFAIISKAESQIGIIWPSRQSFLNADISLLDFNLALRRIVGVVAL